MAAFLANVGVNASHRVRSPLHPDGSFHLHPIPESLPWASPMIRLPAVWGDRAVHLDPDLAGDPPTYGDNCRRAARAFALRRARRGDAIFFLARLHGAAGPGFYLVGVLHVDGVLADVTADPGPGWWDANAHVRRGRAAGRWDAFWVFRGDCRSLAFARAVPFARSLADAVLPVAWRSGRTDMQTIGSHTRAVRRVEGAREDLLRSLCPS